MHLPILCPIAAWVISAGDAAGELRQMQRAFLQPGTWHAQVVILETPHAGPVREMRQELWIDVEGGRVRSEVRDPSRPEPHLTFLAGPRGLLMYHADARQVAQQPGALDLVRALDATLAGELWRTAVGGDLAGMKVESYGAPRLGGTEDVGAAPCLRIEFPGNQASTLWVAKEDHLPRRLEGPLPGMTRREEVRLLERSQRDPAEIFRFVPPEGVTVVPLLLARQDWSRLPPERERWPAPGTRLPAFVALGPDGEPRGPEDLAGPCVLAFWFEDHPPVPRALKEVQAGLEDQGVSMVSVHPGTDVRSLRKLRDTWSLTHETWLDGADAARPFWVLRVASCPVFFLVDEDGTLRTATTEARAILAAVRDHQGAP